MLIRHDSNRVDVLAEALATVLAEPVGEPFQPETLIVQSNGMARWLALRLADRLGVCSNIRFPFPSSFLWQTLRQTLEQALGTLPETASFDKPVLTWRILGLLPQLERQPVFEPLHAYLQAGDDPFRAYDLARSIADVYDQYLVYRPDWIAAWEQGEQAAWLPPEHRWQPELWRRLSTGISDHRARLLQRFAEHLQGETQPAGLPARISVFGVSALAPQQLQLLTLLAQHCELHLFLLNPCQDYWGDIQAERDSAHQTPADSDPADEYLHVGNPLLASLGKQGRDVFDLLAEQPADEQAYFIPTPASNLLETLQNDILYLHERGASDRVRLAPDDQSVQRHICHSPTRELEVLQDQLLNLFERHPDLSPADVVVMTPDIDAYAPMIEAVFGSTERSRAIPYSIADQGPEAEQPFLQAVQQLLELGRGRYGVDQVLGFLELETVRRRFDLDMNDLELIRTWLQHTGVRWGVDGEDRQTFDLPATDEHSWRAGLERLLLGYALPGGGREFWADILPYDPLEGSAAQVLGRLQQFADGLFALRAEVAALRSLTDWTQRIQVWLERFFAPTEMQAEELQAVRSALDRITTHAAQAGFTDPIPLTVVRAALNQALQQNARSAGFFAGGVTFATMVPMRSIPFAVVCLIGMNHGSYPRSHRPADFDLMSQHYRKGDRSRRQDDRYLFLEALLSARKCLYISHVGRDSRDNTVIPPSVLVSELLEVIERGFLPAPGYESVRQHISVEHPLQAFSHRYFASPCDNKLFSYSAELATLSRRASEQRSGINAFFSTPLPPVDESWLTLPPEQLIAFFEHPVKFLLQHRLGLHLQLNDHVLDNQEPFTLDGLERYTLRQHLLAWQLAAIESAQAAKLARAQGLLPHGQVGVNGFAQEWATLCPFTERVQQLQSAGLGESVAVDIQCAGVRIQGSLDGLTPTGLVGYRPATITPKDRLRLWLRHLLVNTSPSPERRISSHWLGLNGELRLIPVTDPMPALTALLQYYQQGLREPLPLFARSSWAYADAWNQGKGLDAALKKARNEWNGHYHRDGEVQDPWIALAFRGHPTPLNTTFMTLAQTFWQPYFQHTTDYSC